MIDFKQEVLKRKDAIIKDLQKLVQINSELTTFDAKRRGAPFGEGNEKALNFMLELAKKDGFKTLNVDGYAGHIELGDQEAFVGSIGHLDVVPAGNGWTYPPYGAEIHDGKMYGRGTEDDKGPTMAVYYAMKILKELNVPLSKRIKLILGVDEESGWRCVRHYFSLYPEQPVSGFIADADFPLIYAEKGIFRLEVKGKALDKRLISFKGGFRDNMVPDYASAKVVKKDEDIALFNDFLSRHNYRGNYQILEDVVLYEIEGKSAHGSLPDLGENAIDRMNQFLLSLGIQNALTTTLDRFFTEDTKGTKLGIAFHDDEMGDLTTNLGVLDYENNRFILTINIRYPNNITFEHILETIEAKLKGVAQFSINHHQHLLYQDPNSHLVKTLLDIYKRQTQDYDALPITIGGGTFARAMKNVVAFGPHFLHKPSFIHQRDEFIEIDDLLIATSIYLEALYELAK